MKRMERPIRRDWEYLGIMSIRMRIAFKKDVVWTLKSVTVLVSGE